MTVAEHLSARRAGAFRYDEFDFDGRTRTLTCIYGVGGRQFEERVIVEDGSTDAPGLETAANLVFLLAGVSYYKAFAPDVIDLGSCEVTPELRTLLRQHYVDGLGEFAYRNDLDLRGVEFVGGKDVSFSAHAPGSDAVERPLIPFGGGVDSVVSVELAKRTTPDAALFVVSGAGGRFEAIETAASATGLPVARATRVLDPTILRSDEFGFLNGHVPVTGILSAIALLAAVMTDRDAVVMSNEWSASSGNLERDGQLINHQYSKSLSFERLLRAALASTVGERPRYFSLLRPFSELWIAREFARHRNYLAAFRSCNRAFHIDPARRLDRWCGRCDKCLFIDLILSPFVDRGVLSEVFGGAEPLEQRDLLDSFRVLIGTGPASKPFECVGDEDECRVAVALAAARPDRASSAVLRALREDVDRTRLAEDALERFLQPIGDHFVPEPYATDLRLA